MKIKQMYSAFGWHLKGKLMQKYGFVNATNINKPVLFFGCYGLPQITKAIKWSKTSPVKIWWSGSDILLFKNNPEILEELKSNNNISHIATVNFIEKDLQEMGLPYQKVPLFSHKIDDFKPEKLGDSIYVYKPGSAVYCPRPIYKRIRDEFKSVNFIEAENHHVFSQSEIIEVYKKSRLGIRLVKHDGLSHGSCEMGLIGRRIIWSGDTPNAIPWEDNIIEAIYKGLEDYDPFELADKVKSYLNVGEQWLEV